MGDAAMMCLLSLFYVGAIVSALKKDKRVAEDWFARCVIWLMVILMCLALCIKGSQ